LTGARPTKKETWVKEHEKVLALDERIQSLERSIEDRDRQLRIYRSRDQDFLERYQSTPDADGIAGRTSLGTFRDKNFPVFVDRVNKLPALPHLPIPGHPGEVLGFDSALRTAKEQLIVALEALCVAPLDNATKVERFLVLIEWVSSDDRVGLMLRDDSQGRMERSDLIQAAGKFAFGSSVPFVFRSSQEVMVEPVDVERRPQPA
jgi:hypothetical protein